jgi:hypothetical protein
LVEHLDGCDFITACTTLTGRHGHDARRHGEGLWLSIGAVGSQRSAKGISSDVLGWVPGPSSNGSRLSQLCAIKCQIALSVSSDAFSACSSASTAYFKYLSL